MRQNRDLAEHVWYKVETAINNREPVFQLLEAVVLFYRVLIEARCRFPFEMRGLTIGDEWLSFYIKPADGYQLPKIMQWMKQTFSARFNVKTGRSGHVWGDRYKSEILVGEPPPGTKAVDWAWVVEMAKTKIPAAKTYELAWASPRRAGGTVKVRFSFKTDPDPANPPG
jgi:hypothetical protein